MDIEANIRMGVIDLQKAAEFLPGILATPAYGDFQEDSIIWILMMVLIAACGTALA